MLGILVIATALGAGVICGWWLRGTDDSGRFGFSMDDEHARAEQALKRLQELAVNVSTNLGEHTTRMRAISEELHDLDTSDPDKVVVAVAKLLESNEQMQSQLNTAEQRLKSQARQIESHAIAARTDALTRLANRRAFDDMMQDCQRDFETDGRAVTVMLLDVDHFKSFNDTYGHQAGDAVLQGVARVLKRHIGSPHLVTRYGGEEFAIVFPGSTFQAVWRMAETARQAINDSVFEFEGMELTVTCSSGLAQWMETEDRDSMIRRADDALYASKEAGRNRGHFHDGQQLIPLVDVMDAEARRLVVRTDSSQTDLERGEFAAGISNREIFCADLDRRLAEWKRGGAPLSVLMFQVDDFDDIIARFGSENKRAILRAAGLFIKAMMRDMDHVARFDAESFSLLLPGTKHAGAISIAERIRTSIARCQLPAKFQCRAFSISVGVAEAQFDEETDSLLQRAEMALDAATGHGRNCCYFHNGTESELVGAGHITLA